MQEKINGGPNKQGVKIKITCCDAKFPKIGKLILYFIFMQFWSLKQLKTPKICLFQHIWSIYKRGAETKIPKK